MNTKLSFVAEQIINQLLPRGENLVLGFECASVTFITETHQPISNIVILDINRDYAHLAYILIVERMYDLPDVEFRLYVHDCLMLVDNCDSGSFDTATVQDYEPALVSGISSPSGVVCLRPCLKRRP